MNPILKQIGSKIILCSLLCVLTSLLIILVSITNCGTIFGDAEEIGIEIHRIDNPLAPIYIGDLTSKTRSGNPSHNVPMISACYYDKISNTITSCGWQIHDPKTGELFIGFPTGSATDSNYGWIYITR